MIFNPLFLGSGSAGNFLGSKPLKLSSSGYLFSDIMKVELDGMTAAKSEETSKADGELKLLADLLVDDNYKNKVEINELLSLLPENIQDSIDEIKLGDSDSYNFTLSESELTDLFRKLLSLDGSDLNKKNKITDLDLAEIEDLLGNQTTVVASLANINGTMQLNIEKALESPDGETKQDVSSKDGYKIKLIYFPTAVNGNENSDNNFKQITDSSQKIAERFDPANELRITVFKSGESAGTQTADLISAKFPEEMVKAPLIAGAGANRDLNKINFGSTAGNIFEKPVSNLKNNDGITGKTIFEEPADDKNVTELFKKVSTAKQESTEKETNTAVPGKKSDQVNSSSPAIKQTESKPENLTVLNSRIKNDIKSVKIINQDIQSTEPVKKTAADQISKNLPDQKFPENDILKSEAKSTSVNNEPAKPSVSAEPAVIKETDNINAEAAKTGKSGKPDVLEAVRDDQKASVTDAKLKEHEKSTISERIMKFSKSPEISSEGKSEEQKAAGSKTETGELKSATDEAVKEPVLGKEKSVTNVKTETAATGQKENKSAKVNADQVSSKVEPSEVKEKTEVKNPVVKEAEKADRAEKPAVSQTNAKPKEMTADAKSEVKPDVQSVTKEAVKENTVPADKASSKEIKSDDQKQVKTETVAGSQQTEKETKNNGENLSSDTKQDKTAEQRQELKSVDNQPKGEYSKFGDELSKVSAQNNRERSEPVTGEKFVQKTVRSTEVMSEISKFVQKSEKNTLVLQIEPKHLGQLKISIDNADHVLKAFIEVDNPQVKQAVENRMQELVQNLAQSGLNLGSVNVSVNNQQDQKLARNLDSKKKNVNKIDQDVEPEVKNDKNGNTVKEMGYNTYEFLA